jgi:hypothetical protein
MKVEEKCSRLLEKTNEEKDKNHEKIIKGRNHGQQESYMDEYKRGIYPGRPSISRYQRRFINYEGSNRREDRD